MFSVNIWSSIQNINKRELYQMSGKQTRTTANLLLQRLSGVCYCRQLFTRLYIDFRTCNVFLMVCLSGIWWSCSWGKIFWKEGKQWLLSTHALCYHIHSTPLSRRNTNLWSWFLEHWDLLLNKLIRGEFPLWWDNKDDILSLSTLWEQIEGLWVLCVHLVQGWGTNCQCWKSGDLGIHWFSER